MRDLLGQLLTSREPGTGMSIENQHQLLDDIDSRQDDILQQLEQLNRDIEQTIRAIVGDREEAGDEEEVAEQDSQDARPEAHGLAGSLGLQKTRIKDRLHHDRHTSAAAAIAALHASAGGCGESANPINPT